MVASLKKLATRVAGDQGKQVSLECNGLDKALPEAYQRPVRDIAVQFIRNAIVHGIEEPWVRTAAHKPPSGKLTLQFHALGGDGYEPQFDPTDPNILYAQYQYGGPARYDRRTQERVYIVPHPESGEDNYKWNWNSPLIVSPHAPTRLYYGSLRLWRSDDRGHSWRPGSRAPDSNLLGSVWKNSLTRPSKSPCATAHARSKSPSPSRSAASAQRQSPPTDNRISGVRGGPSDLPKSPDSV